MKRGRKAVECPDVAKLRELVAAGYCQADLARAFATSPGKIPRWLKTHSLVLQGALPSVPGESWKPIVGWEGFYDVSDLGRVRSLQRFVSNGRGGKRLVHARIMKPYRDRVRSPHMIIQLSRGGRAKEDAQFPLVHKLVLEAFVGPRPPGLEACHNNGDGMDNRLSNLRWDTHQANMDDQLKHGTRLPRTSPPRRWTPGGRGRVPNWYREQQAQKS